jgi:hypothetical protein
LFEGVAVAAAPGGPGAAIAGVHAGWHVHPAAAAGAIGFCLTAGAALDPFAVVICVCSSSSTEYESVRLGYPTRERNGRTEGAAAAPGRSGCCIRIVSERARRGGSARNLIRG